MKLARKIMLLLLVLVALFTVGMGVMSYLNLDYSRQAMSTLRLQQIEDTFYASLHRINTHHQTMERTAGQLATLGELFYRLRQNTPGRDYRSEFENMLGQKVRNFPEAFGGGLWFEPGAYLEGQASFALYAYWHKNQVKLHWAEADSAYTQEEWYRTALPQDWDRGQPRPERFYWTMARYNEVLEAVVITLEAFIYDPTGRIIGIATLDWGVEEITRLIDKGNVTEGSFAFLLDSKNRKFTNLPKARALQYQTLLSELSLARFENYPWPESFIEQSLAPATMQTQDLAVDGSVHTLFFAKTHADMIFGISVPHDEIYRPVERMRQINYQIVGFTLLVLLSLSALILSLINGLVRLLGSLYTDRLTGLPNRTRLLQDIKAGPPVATLVLLNLDDFKELNDFYGHKCGDSVLHGFAQHLKDFVATLEPARPLRLYRMPADEFALACCERIEAEQLAHYLQHLCEFTSNQVFSCAEQEITLTATLGAAYAESDPDSGEGDHLLGSANMALKQAKRQKQHYLVYDASMHIREEYERNITWAKRLKQCLAEDRVVPFFQPVRNNRNGRIEKYECLVRILDRGDNALPPGEFLDIAKKLRLYHHITELMVEKSFRVLKSSPYQFSINLSYQDIVDPHTTEFIKAKLREYEVGPQVVFEILESESIHNYSAAHPFIREVKEMGCKIAIDDFGTGYSNFEHLLRLNADLIKIDGSLIRQLHSNPDARVVTQGIVDFAQKLGMQTIAEYVYCEEVLAEVVALGIDYSQGFLIGRPLRQVLDDP